MTIAGSAVRSVRPGGNSDAGERDDRPLAGRLSQLALAPIFSDRSPELAFLFDQISLLNGNIELLASRLDLPENLIDPQELRGYQIPTLVAGCELDTYFPLTTLQRVADMIPGAESIEIEQAGHPPYWEVPEAFNEIVLSFLARNREAASLGR